MCFYDDYTPRIALAWGSTRQKKEREGEKAVKNESEERKNARERAGEIELVLVQQKLETGAPGDITVSFFSVSDTEPPQGTEDLYF